MMKLGGPKPGWVGWMAGWRWLSWVCSKLSGDSAENQAQCNQNGQTNTAEKYMTVWMYSGKRRICITVHHMVTRLHITLPTDIPGAGVIQPAVRWYKSTSTKEFSLNVGRRWKLMNDCQWRVAKLFRHFAHQCCHSWEWSKKKTHNQAQVVKLNCNWVTDR